MNLDEMLKREKEKIESKIKIGSEILYLTKDQCVEAGPDVEQTLEIIGQTLDAHGRKEYEMPAKIGIHPYDDVFYHAMPAYVPEQMACGEKWIECYPRNPKEFGLPQTSGLMILNEILTGFPMVIMDGAWLTAMRTPAVTSIAAAALHPDAETFGMFGCGVQGIGHVRYIVHKLKNLKKIYVYDVRRESMERLIEQVKDEVDGIELIMAASPQEVAESCDVMSSATIITRENMAVVKKEWVHAGQTILPCDLNTFWEADIQRNADKYIVDSRDEHVLFDGMGYFPDGLPEIYAETGEIVAGIKEGRERKDELIVCSNIGMSVCDVAMAKYIFDSALEKNLGTVLKL